MTVRRADPATKAAATTPATSSPAAAFKPTAAALKRFLANGELGTPPPRWTTAAGTDVVVRPRASDVELVIVAKERLVNGLIEQETVSVVVKKGAAPELQGYHSEKEPDADEFSGYAEEVNLPRAASLEVLAKDPEIVALLESTIGFPEQGESPVAKERGSDQFGE